jgi:hypothetical protein
MLDILPPEVWGSIERTFLEPTCGDGNFLEKILQRKLQLIPKKINKTTTQEKNEYLILRAVASIYGVDIAPDNILACKQRLKQEVLDFWSNTYNTAKLNPRFLTQLDQILTCNIQVGNTLESQTVEITEWSRPSEGTFKPKVYTLAELEKEHPVVKREGKLITYYKDKE